MEVIQMGRYKESRHYLYDSIWDAIDNNDGRLRYIDILKVLQKVAKELNEIVENEIIENDDIHVASPEEMAEVARLYKSRGLELTL